MKIEYKDVPLDTVLRYFADGFKTTKGQQNITMSNAFVDTSKRRVIFELYVDDPPKDKK